MKELDQLKAVWTSQALPPASHDLPRRSRLDSRTANQLRLFDQEQGAGSYLAAAVFFSLISLGLLVLAIVKGAWLPLVPGAVFGFSAGIFWWYRISVQRLGLPQLENNLKAYLEGRLRQFAWLRRLRLAQGVAGASLALVFFLKGGSEEWSAMMTREWVGIGGFLIASLLIAGVLMWWYRTQHPYRVDSLEAGIKELLNQLEDDA